ncbi:dTDP-4-dehydrorhamnose reductase [Actinocrinis puniceicyclus]|uniref:dTDP-4-dehydrorhamnose reductase n=2 Tax=Actinocrinis puniceicyclus TaxID=977794 RepID=A0A8J8BBV3_9ACTN|nr:dTDP-4-dehydrorhamnose reductase [Actinocrinis puniceicyclus]
MLGRELGALLIGPEHPLGEPERGAAPADRAHEVIALGREQLDITDPDALKSAVEGVDIVLNAAAWTDVDGAEAREADATAINGTAVQNLASACADAGAILVHVSTDYVFPGGAVAPIPEDAPSDPVNAYGRSKLVGERAVFQTLPGTGYVVRTAWLYGEHGKNFVSTILNAAGQREFLDVVDDQRGQPTWARALARQLIALGGAALAGSAPAGAYHGTCSGETTWYGLARAAFELTGLDPDRVRPTTSDKFPRPAPRPAYSVLGHERWAAAGLAPLPHWRETLAAFLADSGRGTTGPGAESL